MSELKGQDLLDYYRDALRTHYGVNVAKRAELRHTRGWYYLHGMQYATPCRAAQVRRMADELLRRSREEAEDQAAERSDDDEAE